jgi:hypothetical protein
VNAAPGSAVVGSVPGPATATATDQLADAATQPVVIWTGVACLCLAVVLRSLSSVLPDAIAAWGKMREQRRRDRQAAEDARIEDLSAQVDHLAGRVWTLEQAAQRMTAAVIAHTAWDQKLMTAAVAAGLHVDMPPPLYPIPDE